MKACPACGRLYPDEAGFCPADGQGLRSATQVPIQASDDERVGTLVAMRYQVRRVVADGGMGRVYEALDTHEGRRVAVKMLHSDVAADQVSVERFKREFEVSRSLPHDHIIDVLDFQRDGSTYALVMEFLEGEELRNVLLREKSVTPGRVVRMVSQIAVGLDPAHQAKFVHRDLKPDNIFLCGTREGDTVKILDFGSAKDKSAGAKKLTMLGTTIGSPYYMAPEQAQGLDSLDHRADVWAVAAIAYEALTSTVPFGGNNGPTILLSIMTKEPTPPSQASAKAVMPIPPTLDPVVEHAFYKNPQGRIASVGELANRIGAAYGLQGDFRQWAQTPQHVLDETIKANLPTLLQGGAAVATVGDPFAAPPASAAAAMDKAFEAPPQPQPQDDVVVAGVPQKGVPIVALVAVGVLALVVGIVGVVLLMR
ncbi:MAG: serine/threonine protein kinase [Polyangiaceae bacterium]|nr:serine/threonine protein kinase [Polyangiaceae bacterium]